jgi:UDP-GlcNAc:undecaprenyl-phosphate GlcNAc-1-phosphate transferase
LIVIIGPLAAAFILALISTPFVRKLALFLKATDSPDVRKVHKRLMPRLGGLAICLSFWAVILLTQPFTAQIGGLLAGGLVICLLGVWDDIKGISAKTKLLGQFIAAGIVIYAGIRVNFITNPIDGTTIDLGYWRYPLTVLWIVGMTNAVNLIDGLDGLAAGVSSIAAVSLGIVAWLEGADGYFQAAMLAFILAAATLGFFRHNFYPAKIFMGDTGSLFLGFNLAAIAILSLTKGATAISLFLPVYIFGIPIADTSFAIVRRFLNRKPIFSPDRDHLHHRLLDLGLSHKKTVFTIYLVSAFFGLSSILITQVTSAQGVMIMIGTTLAVFIIADRIGVLRTKSFQENTADKKAYHHTAK